jgi:hypothetical protein
MPRERGSAAASLPDIQSDSRTGERMNNKEADRLEIETGCKPIEFDCKSLFVFFEPQYKKRIVIAGIHGMTDINYDMAIALADNLREIAEMYLEGKE